MTTAKRAALYLRQSKSDDEGIERQRDRTTALATARGWQIVGTYIDDDVSASKPRGAKTAWGRMLAAAATLDVVIAVDLDRIARSTRDLNTLIDHDLALVTVDGEIDLASADGEFRGTMLAAIARFETRRKGERQRRANDQRAAKGLPSARPGYGYVREHGRDVVVAAEAEVIRAAAEGVLAGRSLRSTAADLNARGVASPRTIERARAAARGTAVDDDGTAAESIPWSTATLRQLLLRPSVAGLRKHRGKVIGEFDATAHPAILTRDEHDRLVALFGARERPGRAGGGSLEVHLLSGIARCGRCGNDADGRMYRIPAWNPKPGQKSKPTKAAYACRTCFKVRRLQEPVDALVTEAILRRLEREDAADLLTTGDPEAARELRDKIEAVTARLATAADLFAAGTIDGDQLARITASGRAEREALEAQLTAALPRALPVDAVGPGVRSAWEGYDVERRRLIVSTLARITIMPTKPGRSFDPELIRIDWITGPDHHEA